MKVYEAPTFEKIDFFTEDVLGLDGSILDPTDGLDDGSVEIGKIPLFG